MPTPWTVFWSNTMSSTTYSQGKRQTHSHLTDPMTSKSMSKKVQNPFMDQSTPCPPQNSWPCGNSLRNIPGMDSSAQGSLHGTPLFYLSKRKMAASAYVLHTVWLIQMVSNAIRTLQCTSSLPEVHQ